MMSTTTTTNVDFMLFSQSELENIISVSGMAIWEYNIQTKKLKLNDNWIQLLGYTEDDFEIRLSTFFKLIHPEDVPKFENAALKYLTDPTLKQLNVQYRMKTKSGNWLWLRNRSKIIFDSNNRPISWMGSVMDISLLKESEQLNSSQNKHLNSVVNSLSDIVYEIDKDYNFINCWVPDSNPSSKTVRAYKGKNIKEVFSTRIFKLFKKLVDDTLLTHTAQTLNYQSKKSDKYFLARTTLISRSSLKSNHVIMVVQDITSNQQTRNELALKESNLNAMIQNTSDVFWAIDKDEKIIVFNKAFYELYANISSYKAKVGAKLNDDFLLDETAKRWRLIHKRSLHGHDTVFSKHVFFTNGDVRLYEFHINPFRNSNNEIIGSVVTGRDIDDIYTAKKQAEKSARLKSKFVSTISHEIRTPLNAILGTCHQLERNNLQDNLKEDLNILKLASDNLLSLINDVLDFTKLESGKVIVKPTPFNLQEFLSAFKQFTQNLALKSGLDLITQYDENLPKFVTADKTKIHQILTNLLSNAVKYTENGMVTMKVQNVETLDGTATLKFEVSDTGIGIPKKELDGIFDSFTQSSTSYHMLKGGTGLGLSITKNLVELLNGTIEVNSKVNQGSIFTLHLPLKVTAEENILAQHPNTISDLKNRHILVAEDNEINAKIITRLLGQWNATYELATNGQVASDLAEVTKFDLILMDIQMPEKNGFEAANEIRSIPEGLNNNTSIIALTAQPDFSFDPSYREELFDGYILKPFHPEKLKEKIISYLN